MFFKMICCFQKLAILDFRLGFWAKTAWRISQWLKWNKNLFIQLQNIRKRDVYSFAFIAYEIIIGEKLFVKLKTWAIFWKKSLIKTKTNTKGIHPNELQKIDWTMLVTRTIRTTNFWRNCLFSGNEFLLK